jgi:type I restriction enzyme S subunit
LGGNNTLFYDAIELVGGGKSKTTVEDYWSGEIKWLSGGDIASNHKSIIISSEKKNY